MKRCSGCGQEKEAGEFGFRRGRKDQLQDYCKECGRQYHREHYRRHKEEYYARRKKEMAKRRQESRKKVLEYLRNHPCVDCGEADPVVLEFDHVNGEKEFDVSQMICHGTKWERIAAEIEKCEVRCANCYKRRTAKRGGCFKSGVVS